MDYIDFRRSWPKNAMAVSKSGFDLNCGREAIRIIVGGCRACTTSHLKLAGWREKTQCSNEKGDRREIDRRRPSGV